MKREDELRDEVEGTTKTVDPLVSAEDVRWMQEAMREATRALEHADVPIGAVVVLDGQQIGAGYNTRERDQDPCGHAEIHALREAARRRGSWRLDGCTLYVTLEPCAMCAGAMVLARLGACVWAAPDPKGGFLGTLGNLGQDTRLNHRFTVRSGVLQEEAAALLRTFFRGLRQRRKAQSGSKAGYEAAQSEASQSEASQSEASQSESVKFGEMAEWLKATDSKSVVGE